MTIADCIEVHEYKVEPLIQNRRKGHMSETSASLVLREDTAGVAVLTLNRYAKHNAMNQHVMRRLEQHLDDIEKDDSIDVVLVTGSGEKAFVAGADIQELSQRLPYDALIGTMQRLYDKI